MAADTTYEPGFCNIGYTEQRKRYAFGAVGGILAVTVLVSGTPFSSPFAAVALFLALVVGFEGTYQGYLQFCAGFAASGVYDVSGDGSDRQDVEDWAARERDVRKARRIHLYSILSAVILTATVLGFHL